MASIERYYPTVGGPIIEGEEAASQNFKKGDPVQFASGFWAVAAAGAFDGIARTDASGTQSTNLEIELLDPGAIYVSRVETGTTHAQTLVGTMMDFVFTTPGAMGLEDGTTDVVVVGLDPRDAIGAVNGRVLWKPLYALFTGA